MQNSIRQYCKRKLARCTQVDKHLKLALSLPDKIPASSGKNNIRWIEIISSYFDTLARKKLARYSSCWI